MKVGNLVKIKMPNDKSKRNGIKGIVLARKSKRNAIDDEMLKVALLTGEIVWMYSRYFEKLNKQEV